MFHNGLAWARRVERLTIWLTDQACRLETYASRWVQALDPGETGWMDE